MKSKLSCSVEIVPSPRAAGQLVIYLHAEQTAILGAKGRIGVAGTLNGIPLKATLMPDRNGTHYLLLNKQIREKSAVKAGDKVTLVLVQQEKDDVPELPDDMQQLLEASKPAKEQFYKMPPSHQKEFVRWITDAKKPETRALRMEKTIEMLLNGK
jgi:hypothetical protein